MHGGDWKIVAVGSGLNGRLGAGRVLLNDRCQVEYDLDKPVLLSSRNLHRNTRFCTLHTLRWFPKVNKQ